MIIFDATSRPSLLELIIPGLEMAFNKTVRDGVGVLRYQLRDKSLSYQTLDDDRWSARLLLLAELLKQPDKEIGLIIPKKVENVIADIADSNVLINHFGALKGGNSFEKVSALIVASRPAVHFAHTEDMATVLTGKNVQKLPQNGHNLNLYPKKTTFIKHRDGKTGWPVQNDYHPDPVVEQVRCSITNDNLEQALGRSRNIRRTKQTPQIIEDQVAEYKSAMDSISQFIREECELGKDHSYPASKFFQAYRDWCSGAGRKPQSQTAFKRSLEKLNGVYQSRTSSGMQWSGIKPVMQF